MTTSATQWNNFVARLRDGLARPRNPRDAWREFEPSLAYGRHAGPPFASARPAAVTILSYPVDDASHLVLTRRHEQLRSHAGQISFPGGAIDAGETPAAAALRELEEELGVPFPGLEVAGQLSPIYIFNSNFVVTPVVVLSAETPKFTIHDAEVAELLQTPLADLLSPSARGMHLVHRGRATIEAPHLIFGGHQIWGATCMILAEFLSLIAPDRLGRSHATPL
jgi:8-oxo-dGTP pyrophosphatase MutT (NUDIX family)